MAVSPVNYMEKFAAAKQKSLFIYTEYDTHFSAGAFARHRGQDAGIFWWTTRWQVLPLRPLHAR